MEKLRYIFMPNAIRTVTVLASLIGSLLLPWLFLVLGLCKSSLHTKIPLCFFVWSVSARIMSVEIFLY